MAVSYSAKFEPIDWHKANDFLATTASNQRDASDQLRQHSTNLRQVADNKTTWTQHESKTALEDRALDINKWRRSLETCLKDVETEIGSMEKSKDAAEQCLAEKVAPLDVVVACLTLRESRVSIDQVRDNAELQLHKELEVIEGCRALLGQKVTESYNQLGALQEARHQLQLDIADKGAAEDLDKQCVKLDSTSTNVGLWRNATRVEKGIVTPKTWDAYSNYNTMRAQAEVKASVALRDANAHTIAQTNSDLQAQHRTTNSMYRRRLHEMKQTRDDLLWQQKTTSDEIAELEQEAATLTDALNAKQPPMMIAQTRLEARTQRPNVELCRDQAQHGLTTEVDELTGTMRALAKQLHTVQEALARLQRTLQRINNDLAVKDNSLAVDIQCMQRRQAKLTDCDSTLSRDLLQAVQQEPEQQQQQEPELDQQPDRYQQQPQRSALVDTSAQPSDRTSGRSSGRGGLDRTVSFNESHTSTARSSVSTLSQSTVTSP